MKERKIRQNKHLQELLYDHCSGLSLYPFLLEEEVVVKQAGCEVVELNVEEGYHNSVH
jgi:hypothetical protein